MRTLNLLHPMGMKRQGEEFTVFMYDVAAFKRLGYGRKRVRFLLELCLEQGVTMYHGDTQEVLDQLIHIHQIDHLVLQRSYDETLNQWLIDKADGLKITLIEDELMMQDVQVIQPSFFKFYQRIEPRLRKRAKLHVQSHLDL